MTEKNTWKKTLETGKAIGAGAGIAALGKIAFEEILTTAGKKTIEAVGKKVSDALQPGEAKHTDDDEISVRKILLYGDLTPKEKKDFKSWLGRLRDSNPDLASEVTGRLHNIRVKLTEMKEEKQEENKETDDDKDKKKDNNKKKTAKKISDDSKGIAVAIDLIREIVNAPTDPERLIVLKWANIIVPPKSNFDRVTDFLVKKAKEKGKEIRDSHQKYTSIGTDVRKKAEEKLAKRLARKGRKI